MCNQLGGSGLETSILPKTMQEIELHTKFECPARAYQDEYCTGCNPQFVKHCLKSTAKDNTTKKKKQSTEYTDQDSNMMSLFCILSIFSHRVKFF